jgi:hypothetical protein
MSVTLGEVITAARDRHPAFHPTRVTNAVFARFLSDFQNELIGRAVARDPGFLAQSLGIALNLDAANAPGTVGAGTTGGLPADVIDDALVVSEETAGGLVFPLTSVAEGGVIVVAERVVSVATANTISSTGAGRTVNEDAQRLVHITAGKGLGQVREIASNAAAQWVLTADWDTVPDATSKFTVIAPTIGADETLGVVTALPALSTRRGYLVRLNAQGAPYIDYTQPLSVSVDRGVPLPSMLTPLGGTVRYVGSETDELCLTSYRRRLAPPASPAVYVESGSLYLCGDADEWVDVTSIELRYVPVAPVFAALTDYFLVPDAARPAAIEAAAAFAAGRCEGIEGISLDVDRFDRRALESREAYLGTLRLKKRSQVSTTREGYY